MTNGLSPAGLIARSAAFARSLAPRKPFPFRQRRGGVRSALKPASLLLAAAVLLAILAVVAGSISTAEAQDATITSLLSRLDVRVVSSGATTQSAGYDASNSQGSLSPAGFNYPAGFGPWYTVEALAVNQGTTSNPTSVVISVRGTVTSVASSGTHRAHVLPSGASITLHLEGENFSKSYSLKNPNERTVTKCVDVDEEGNETERHCRVGETTTEEYDWTTNLPPRLANGDKVIVRLRYSAPRPGKPGTPTVTAPTGKSGALVVEWTVPMIPDPDSMDESDMIPDPKVRGYEVHLSPAAGDTDATGVTRTTGGSTTRLPVLLLEPDTAYNVRVRARTYLASGPWSDTATATTNQLQGANNPQVELDLNDVTKVKQGDSLPLRLKVTGMANLHAGAFDMYLGERIDNYDVEFRVLGGIAEWYEYEDGGGGCGGGAFYGGGLTIGEDGEVYHDFGSLMVPDNKSDYGPLYIWLGSGCGAQPHSQFSIGSTANSRATALCVEIADDSNTVPSDRECPSPDGSAGHAVDRLTGRFVNVPKSHDGESEFTLRLAFVKDVGISPTSLLEDALAATGGAVTQVQRVDDRSDLFEVTVEPDSDEDVTITLSSSGDCGEAGSICTQEEDPRKLDNSPTATVAGPILTANFQGLPSQHDGETAFRFRIAFSDEIATDAAEFRDHSVEVWGGEVTRAEPVGQRRDLWEVEVEPASDDMVMVSLKLTQSCAATGAVCTAGGRLLSVVPATMVPGPATWPVQITGEARVGKTLTADSSNLSERYGVQVTSMTYRWLADGARVPGAIGRTYQPDDDQQGKRISVMATYTDDRGNEETVTSGPTEPLAARERIRRATGLPLISGRALVGHTLTADTSLIIDPNGLENAVFHYFWEADDDSIPDATDPTYTPVEADVGKEITVIVAWVDDAGHGQNMTSQPTMPVMTAEAAAAVDFRKSLRVAANADGSVTLYWNAPDDEVTGYRILRHRHSLGELDPLVYVADTGGTTTTYTDTGMVAGVPHNYRVQAIRDGVLGERTIQIKIFPVRKATNSPATGAPAISGTAQVGETLTADISGIADEDGLENVTKNYLWAAIGSSGKIGSRYAYQWLVDGADSGSGDHHAGYDNTTYILTEDDVGKAMSVRVTFVDDAGYQETLTSAATDPVAAAPQPNSPARGAPTIGGTAQVGETLTVDTSGITDEDGLDDSTFTHQWVREDSVMVASAARSYTPTDGDRGKSVKVRVSFTDDAGNRETRTSTQTATVEARDNSAGICDRTEQVRDNIIGLLNAQDLGSLGIEDCSEVTDEQLTRIRFLDLAGGGTGGKITSLKSGDFEGLSGMSELNLEDNSLSELPEGVFDGLSSLELLTTQGNDLSSLPDGVFDDLTNLHTLALYDNDLAALPDGVFDGLSKLRTLAISDNKLTALAGDVFTGLGGLTRLVASNNKLTSLPDGVFSGMSKLQSVSFSGNPSAPFTLTAELERQGEDGVVVKVSEGAPFAMTVTLSAEGGTLSATTVVIGGGDTESADVTVTPEGAGAVTVSVDSAAFPDAGTVHDGIQTGVGESLTLEAAASGICDRTAQVRDAILDKLPDTSDCALVTETDLSYLQGSLDLNNSDITTLKSGDFEGLSRLIGIKLRRNNLSALPDGVFDDLGNLTVLYLDANHLSELPAGVFDDLTNLFYLNLGQNGLSELPAGVFDELSNLVHLYLSFNNNPNPAVYPENTLDEDDLPAGAFGNLSKLRKLDLSDNNLSVLPDGWFTGLTSLVNVKLIGNPGATFTVTAELKQNGADTVVVKVTQGAPFDMLVTLSAEGGTLATTTVTVEGGSDSSGPVTVTPTGEGGTPVTVSVESVTFQNYQPQHTRGIQAGTGTSLTLNTPATDPVASASNNPATGAPTISGTAQVGETLTAGISGIADADGLGGETFTYQWVSSDGTTDTDIEKATDSTYKLVAADKGNSIKVRVTFTDYGGNEETLTSAATGPVLGDGLPGAPRNLTATPGNKEITLSWDPPDDNGNAPATRYRIEWRVDGKDYDKNHWGTARSTTYTTNDQANLANGVKYFFRVKAGNGDGNSQGPYGPASGEVSATPTSGSAVDLGTPVLSNTETLHHGMVRLDWQDVEDAGWYVVQYYHVKGGEWLDLPAEGVDIAFHGSSAVVSNLHGLSWLRVRAMSCAGESEWSQIEQSFGTNASDWDGVPVPEVEAGDEIEPCPVVLGTPVLSDTETLHHGMVRLDWQDIEDAGWYVVQYYHVKGGEWLDLPAEGVDIAFHGSSAVVSNLHGLSWLRVRAMSCAGESEWSQIEQLFGTNASDWDGVPVPEVAEGDEIEPCSEDADTPDNSPATGAPTISGTARVGEGLEVDTSGIADADGLANVTFSYQWLSSRDTEIGGATSSTYTLQPSDAGKTISVQVSFNDDAGNGESLTSAATDAVAAAPTPNNPATGAPTIIGTAQVRETLTAGTSNIADDDGLANVSFSYQWLAGDTEVQGATNADYTLADADEGQTIKVRVSFTDGAGNQEMLTSAPTAAVAAPAQADSEDEPSELSYLTVVVTEDDSDPDNVFTTFTITWNDAEDCSASYNAYLDGVVGDPIHLGSAASEGEQIAASLTNVSAESIGFVAKLYCGTIGSGRLVDSLWIPEYSRSFDTVPISRAYLPKPGTYSTEPGLTVLTVSSGTLAPAFHSQTLNYTVPDVANADGRITLTTTTKADYYNVAFIPGSLYFYIASCSHGGQQTSLSYQDDTGNPLYPLTDADANTPGFQMELDEGENVFKIHVWPNCESGHVYKLTVTRAANAPANNPATGAPTISGTAQVGETLTADTSGISDADGLENVAYNYQWLSSRDTEIQGATDAAYILVPGDAGKTIKVKVSFTDDEGNAEMLTSAATDAVSAEPTPNNPATGAPTISGTAQVGETLAAETSGINDDDGLDNVAYTYQWLSSRDTEIQGATDRTYTLAATDEGKAIKVRVSFTDDANNQETLTSAATDAVAAAPTPNTPATGAPTITGTAQVGETLIANTSGIADADGLSNVQYEYQWLADDADIAGATSSTYTLTDGEESKAIKVQVTFTDDAGNDESLTSAATDAVAAAPTPNSPATGAPTINGTAQVGETLTANTSGIADADGLSNVQYEYQWLADDADIAGATSLTYTLADTDEGKAVTVEVSFVDDEGNDESMTSAATDAVAAEPSEPPDKPTGLDATASHGQVVLTWNDPDDESITGYVILRRIRVNDQGGDFSVLVANTESAATTYTDNEVAASTTYTYRIKAINQQGTSERSRWVHIDTPAPPVPDKPTGLEAAASNGQVVLTWDDPDDDSITGYVILRRLPGVDPEGQFDELVADTGTAATSYTDDTVAAETRYTYRIKAINEHGTSERSRWVHISTPAAP